MRCTRDLAVTVGIRSGGTLLGIIGPRSAPARSGFVEGRTGSSSALLYLPSVAVDLFCAILHKTPLNRGTRNASAFPSSWRPLPIQEDPGAARAVRRGYSHLGRLDPAGARRFPRISPLLPLPKLAGAARRLRDA